MRISLPSTTALASFSHALSASLQTVFLETFILAAASSKVSFSNSTSLRASISAGSKKIDKYLCFVIYHEKVEEHAKSMVLA